jgi:hypothetical protein
MSISSVFTPRGFLTWGGAMLLLLGVLGYLGVLSRSTTPQLWLDDTEKVVLTVLGVGSLAITIIPGISSVFQPFHRWIVVLLGLAALFFAVYGFYVAGDTSGRNTFGVANLESPVEVLLFLAIAGWALVAGWGTPRSSG